MFFTPLVYILGHWFSQSSDPRKRFTAAGSYREFCWLHKCLTPHTSGWCPACALMSTVTLWRLYQCKENWIYYSNSYMLDIWLDEQNSIYRCICTLALLYKQCRNWDEGFNICMMMGTIASGTCLQSNWLIFRTSMP